jgi:hypothetical protein
MSAALMINRQGEGKACNALNTGVRPQADLITKLACEAPLTLPIRTPGSDSSPHAFGLGAEAVRQTIAPDLNP